MNLADFDYPLDRSLIAQRPLLRRGTARLMLLDRETGGWRHGTFADFLDELTPKDLVVLNQTKVIPARVVGKKAATGGAVELLFLHPTAPPRRAQGKGRQWKVLAKGSLREGQALVFPDGHGVTVASDEGGGCWRVTLNGQGDFFAWLNRVGQVPVPPYIHRTGAPPEERLDRRRYQTLYARVPGSVAAPTAGLHFSAAQLRRLRARRVPVARLTLHIGVGTFQPIRSKRIDEHTMAAEYCEVGAPLCRAVERTRRQGGRVVAVGTSTVRALESAAASGRMKPFRGWTDLFIRPGHAFRAVDALLTNFHLPKSSLLCLVGAFAGRERLLAAYRAALEARYRFYSYGDAMFIRTGGI